MISGFGGLDLLATAVVVLDEAFIVRYANPAAESLFSVGLKILKGQPLPSLFVERASFEKALADSLVAHWSYSAQNVSFATPGQQQPETLSCVITRIDAAGLPLLVELRPIEQQLRLAREERLIDQQQASRELIRNLAHEIKNPLGGLRGSAQLLERELEKPELREYTQVIIKEADRLQALMDRLLTPHRTPRLGPVNIHEILERVRSLLTAEFASGVEVRRDYDVSVPEVVGDIELLIQAVLNVARNAAQAVMASGGGTVEFRTRVARQITIARRHHRLALELQVIDDGAGIAPEIRDKVFNPLVSGREGGSGVGLSLAQTFVQYHQGVIECDSRPGRTVFRILLPFEGVGKR